MGGANESFRDKEKVGSESFLKADWETTQCNTEDQARAEVWNWKLANGKSLLGNLLQGIELLQAFGALCFTYNKPNSIVNKPLLTGVMSFCSWKLFTAQEGGHVASNSTVLDFILVYVFNLYSFIIVSHLELPWGRPINVINK